MIPLEKMIKLHLYRATIWYKDVNGFDQRRIVEYKAFSELDFKESVDLRVSHFGEIEFGPVSQKA